MVQNLRRAPEGLRNSLSVTELVEKQSEFNFSTPSTGPRLRGAPSQALGPSPWPTPRSPARGGAPHSWLVDPRLSMQAALFLVLHF